ncbi:MAG: acetyl-CoA carboxylase subunit beta [Vampirovibrio sp.]|jgi:acetyl-CoA carboxylase carboxyl transferase subunit beta|nr:acetyl-CoA carboxylase subunit beta [Vampirovibrio sp.]
MSLRDWFASKRDKSTKLDVAAMNTRLTDEEICKLWTQCFNCQENLPTKELEKSLMVCPQCGYHFRIGAHKRIMQLCDDFMELDADLLPADPLEFTDTEPYAKRQKDARKKTGLNEAVVCGIGQIGQEQLALAVMDFTYLGGSMGSVVGEKITRLIEKALEHKLPVVIFSSSGGARMQEGTFSLMQMVKTGAALARLHEAGLLYISVLTEPTFGGVTASFGTLGDITIAEEGARIGFAGRRVIEQTIRQKLPADFQTATYLLNYGQVDMVLPRGEVSGTLASLIRLHRLSSGVKPVELALAGTSVQDAV